MTSFTCPQCHGSGEEITTPCQECIGEGRLERIDETPIEIPAGIEDGTHLRMSGRGEAGPRGGGSGDLYVEVHVLEDPRFHRNGDDLGTELSVSFAQATLGTQVTFDSFDGKEDLTIPAGTQPGQILKIKGKGIPHLRRSGRGDLLVEIQVEIPKKLKPEEEELLRRFAASRGEAVGEQVQGGIMGKIRGAFSS